MNSILTPDTLRTKYEALRADHPGIRIRNAAETLGVSEIQLLILEAGEKVTWLRPEFREILAEVKELGKVMALTRNEDCVHERKGVYLNEALRNPHVGLFVNPDIDLRIFWGPWTHAFAVTAETARGTQKSLQFFNQFGEAIHKIYLTPSSYAEKFEALVEKYRAIEQPKMISVEAKPVPEQPLPDSEIDVEGFRKDWVNLKDTHDFYGMLKSYNLARTQALRLAPTGNFAVKVSNSASRRIVTAAAERGVEIMCFVGNTGMIQIHTGPVKHLKDYGPWFNILDPDFNLHLNESSIHESWVVRKPTEDGVVTALEVFDKDGNQIVQFFEKRKPGIPELDSWREIVAKVEENERMG